MKCTYLLFVVIFTVTFSASGQTKYSRKEIDSLSKVSSDLLYSNPSKAFQLSKELQEASQKINYTIGEAISLYNQSIYFSDYQAAYKKALSYNDLAIEKATKIKNDSLLFYFNFRKSTLFGNLGLYEKAMLIIEDCLSKTNVIKSKKNRYLIKGTLYSTKAKFLAEGFKSTSDTIILNYYIKANTEFEQVLEYCQDPGYSNVGLYYFKIKNFDKAEYYYKKALQFLKNKNNLTCEFEYTYLGELYKTIGNYPKAIKYIDSSTAVCLKMPMKNHAILHTNYSINKDIYTVLNQKDSVVKYKLLELAYKDTLTLQQANQTKESFSYIIDKNEQEKAIIDSKIKWIYAIAVISLLLLGGATFYFYRKKNKLNKESNQKERALKQKSSEIIELKHKVTDSFNELIELAKNNDPLFISFFKELYPEFYKKLMDIQPLLTLSEQRVCFYLKLQFTTKEIAEYTFVSVKAIQNRKNRLRKRLNIQEGEDLYQWIDAL